MIYCNYINILKKIAIGFFGGSFYAIVNFCFVTPFLRNNLMAVLFWGFQGAFFAIIYIIFSAFWPNSKRLSIFFTLLKGGICGLLSSLLNIILTWQGFLQATSESGIFILPEVSQKLNLDLLFYAIGCFVIGAIVFLFIESKSVKGVNESGVPHDTKLS
jgi:hypothetical protein